MSQGAEDDCTNPRHWEYYTWPISLPSPRAFQRGHWPRPGGQADRLWARLRYLGLIRMRHVQPH